MVTDNIDYNVNITTGDIADEKAGWILKHGNIENDFSPEDYDSLAIRDYNDDDLRYLHSCAVQYVASEVKTLIHANKKYFILDENKTDETTTFKVMITMDYMLAVECTANTITFTVLRRRDMTDEWKHDDTDKHNECKYDREDYEDGLEHWFRVVGDELTRYAYIADIEEATDEQLKAYKERILPVYTVNSDYLDDDASGDVLMDMYDEFLRQQIADEGRVVEPTFDYYEFDSSTGSVAHLPHEDEIKDIIIIDLRDNEDSLIYNLSDRQLAYVLTDDNVRNQVFNDLIGNKDVYYCEYYDMHKLDKVEEENDWDD